MLGYVLRICRDNILKPQANLNRFMHPRGQQTSPFLGMPFLLGLVHPKRDLFIDTALAIAGGWGGWSEAKMNHDAPTSHEDVMDVKALRFHDGHPWKSVFYMIEARVPRRSDLEGKQS